MNRNKIIIYSAIIIAGFALLFYLESPKPKPRSEVREFIRKYEGRKGFAIIRMPDFLMGEIMPSEDSSDISKDNFEVFRVMIFHQREAEGINCQETEQALIMFLDSLKFQQMMQEKTNPERMMTIYEKGNPENWKENVTLYTSDSTLFMFNYINNLNKEQVIEFSNQLGNQDFL